MTERLSQLATPRLIRLKRNLPWRDITRMVHCIQVLIRMGRYLQISEVDTITPRILPSRRMEKSSWLETSTLELTTMISQWCVTTPTGHWIRALIRTELPLLPSGVDTMLLCPLPSKQTIRSSWVETVTTAATWILHSCAIIATVHWIQVLIRTVLSPQISTTYPIAVVLSHFNQTAKFCLQEVTRMALLAFLRLHATIVTARWIQVLIRMGK